MFTFKISIPTDKGFIGRECNNPECKKYFKIFTASLKDKMYCPYCGILFDKNELWTKDQLEHVIEGSKEEILAYASKEFIDMLTKATRGSKVLTFKPDKPYMPKSIPPKYSEKKVDSELECAQCKTLFQVYGIFGYCPSCKCDNILIYDTNIQIILKEIENSNDKKRALRHAYNDLISTFETFCKNKNISNEKYNFQNLESAKVFFQNCFNINMFQEISPDEEISIKRVFQKRHVYQHNKGIIDQKYISLIPEDSYLLNKEAFLTQEEFIKGTEVMRKILVKLL